MSLLLCFFVLLLSLSTMNVVKFSMMMKSIRVGFGQMSSVAIVQPNVPQFGDKSKQRSSTAEQSIYLAMRVEELIDEADLSSSVEMTQEESGILLRIRGNLLFKPGLAEIEEESLPFLDDLSGLIQEFPYHVLVKGHTDDSSLPVDSPFPSNWELSSARASAVVRQLINRSGLSPNRFGVMGLGSTQPLVRNDSPEARQANRRVEFLLVNQTARQAKDGVSIF